MTAPRHREIARARIAVLLCVILAALARPQAPLAAQVAGANTLVMPFDARADSVSFLAVSHRADAGDASASVRTHWSFWSDRCEHLLEATICLPPDGSVVVDPTRVAGADDPQAADLSGRRGFVTVTAYEQTRAGCEPTPGDVSRLAPASVMGTFTLARPSSGAAFGGDAIAITTAPDVGHVDLPGAGPARHPSGLHLQTFAPAQLDESRVIVLALRERAGAGALRAVEPGPAQEGAEVVAATARFTDSAGTRISLPDVSFGCALFASLRREDPDSLLPGDAAEALSSGGVLEIGAPTIGGQRLGDDTWLFGFHGQALGTFGLLAVGKPETESDLAPTPAPSAAATATPARTPGGSPGVTPAPGGPTPTPASSPGVSTTPLPSPSLPGTLPTTTPAATAGGGVPTPTSGAPAPTGGVDPSITPGTTPGPTPTSGGQGPSPAPSGAATPGSATPALPTPVGPTPPATRTPPPAPTPPPAGCDSVTLLIRTAYGPGGATNVAGVLATLSYSEALLSLPGSGSGGSIADRVSNASGIDGLFQIFDGDADGNGKDDNVRIALVSVSSAIPPGAFAEVTFDCVSGTTPPAGALACSLEASDLEGELIPGAACTTEILP